ncbi:14 kDa subunit of cytochrome bd ubiquinol oxidase [Meredithblackwellia eburnea MCA 4105]
MSVLGPSFAKQVKASRTLYNMLKPVSDAYAHIAGYRQYGLKYDDILIEENKPVQKALSRLTERESYDRAFRLRLASMCSIAHAPLPQKDWVPKEADTRYLKPIVESIEKELDERAYWDTVVPTKKAHH